MKAATNEGLRSMAAEIYSQYRHVSSTVIVNILTHKQHAHTEFKISNVKYLDRWLNFTSA